MSTLASGSPSAFSASPLKTLAPSLLGNGKVLLNGPYANIYNDVFASFFGLIIIGAIFGTSILRDFQRDTTQILFTKPITKFAYLGGRWAGSFLATAFAFSGLIFGELLGTLAPWADHTRIAPTHIWWYLQPFLFIVMVQVFFIGSLFFMVAALTRRIFIVYVQGAGFLILYLIGLGAFSATRSTALFWPGVFDPVGVILNDSITRYWTVVDKNTLLYSWSLHSAGGVFFYNRILWIGIGFLTLGLLWKFFPMSLEALTARTSSKRARIALEQDEELLPVRSRAVARIPLVQQFFGIGTSLAQYFSLTRMRVRNIVRDVPFWVLLVLMAGVALNNGHYAGRVEGVNVWPVTYLMLQSVEGGAIIFLYIVSTFYAAELIWRERDTRFEGIHDALPMKESTDWLSKLTALCVVELALLTIAGLCGIIMQTVAGYYHYELLQYAKELYIVTFPQVLIFALLAMFVQTIVSNKFIGHGIVIGCLPPAGNTFQLRLGEHALSFRSHSAVHIFRHERLRTLRSAIAMVDHLLAIDRGILRCPLHRIGASGRGRLAACATAPAAPECTWNYPCSRCVSSNGGGQRVVVLLQHPCVE